MKGKHKDLKEFLKIIHEQNENIKRYSNCKKYNCEILYEVKNLLEGGNSRHVLLQKKSTNHKEGSKGEDEEQKSIHSYKKCQNCKAYTSLLVVTLNVNRLNFPIKCCRIGDETVSNYMMFKRDPFLDLWICKYGVIPVDQQ